MQMHGDLRRVLRVSPPVTVRFRAGVAKHSVLSFGIVVRPLTARLVLRIVSADTPGRRIIHEEMFHGVRHWSDRAVSLAGLAPGETDVDFELSGDAVMAGISEPTVLQPGSPRPNVLVYLVDCLRADRVGAYGYPRPTTPAIDRLASQAFVFERAFACAGWTKPSVGCLLTGLAAPRHGARTVGAPLDPGIPTLASRLAAGGYATAAFVANPVVEGAAFGYARGFDRYVELAAAAHGKAVNTVEADASELTAVVLPWIRAHRDRPFFLYVHSLDLHYPYRARRGFEALVRQQSQGLERDSDLYDSELAANDREIGRLLEELEKLRLDARTIVVVTSDHGEEFGEHGTSRHGHSLYDEVLRIPLILRPAARLPASRRIDAAVSNIDIAPTLLDLASLEVPAGRDGESLLPLLGGGTLVGRYLYAEQITAKEVIYAARGGPYKLVRQRHPVRRDLLFDLADDPEERHNLAGNPPAEAGDLSAALDAFMQSALAGHHVVLADAPAGRIMHAEITADGRVLEALSLQGGTGDVLRPPAQGGAATLRYTHAGGRRVLLVRTDPEDAVLRVRLFEGGKLLPEGFAISGASPETNHPSTTRAWVYRVAKPADREKLSPESLRRMRALGYID